MKKTSIALIALATVIGIISIFALWAKRQLLETDTWTSTSTALLADPDVQPALTTFLVDQIYANVDVEAKLRELAPPKAAPLAGPVAGALREVAEKAALRGLQTDQFQELWKQANVQAHAAFLKLVEDDGSSGPVTLELGTLVDKVGERAGIDVADKLPPQAGELVLIQSDELGTAQDVVNLLRKGALILPLLTLLLFGLAIFLERGRRRQAVRAAGIGFLVGGIVVLIAHNVAGNAVVDSLAKTDSVKPAVDSVWSIGTSVLREIGAAAIFYGIAIMIGTWLAGPTGLATAGRRELAGYLHDRSTAYAGLALLLLLLFWWSPTPGFQRIIPSIVLIALFIGGLEALRAQTRREFPGETRQVAAERRERWVHGLFSRS